jgi:antitoxin VapB
MGDAQAKLQRVRSLLAERRLDAAFISRLSNFAWLTDGTTCYVNTASDSGVASLLVTDQAVYLLTNTIEASRLQAEEPLADLAPELRVAPWYEADPALAELTRGRKLGADAPLAGAVDLSQEFVDLRARLTPAEQQRFAELGRLCAQSMDAAIRQVRPGMNEFQMAGLLADQVYGRGALPIVLLVAADERIFKVRHPIPTGRAMEHYAMLVLCGRRHGLVASITRLVHFGRLSDELRRKQLACARVDATLISHTRPGARIADVFQAAVDAYAAGGFPGEWQHHHQGGPASYDPRDWLATPTSPQRVDQDQAYAWNPSIAGVKSEDTILVGADRNQVLTTVDGWPMLSVSVDGQTWQRPAILEM